MSGPGLLFHDRYEYALPTGQRLAALADAGITAIGLPWEHLVGRDGMERHTLDALRRDMAAAGVSLATVEAPSGTYDEEMCELIRGLIGVAGTCGARIVTLCTGGACMPGAPSDYFDVLLRVLRELLPEARRAGITLALRKEYDPMRHASDRSEKLVRAVQACGDAAVRLCMDVGLSNLHRSALENFHLMQPWLVQVNLSDSRDGMCDRLQPGYGNAPWDALGRLLAARPDIRLFLACRHFDGAALPVVQAETRALLEGRVYTRPDGGWIGRQEPAGRLLIRPSRNEAALAQGPAAK